MDIKSFWIGFISAIIISAMLIYIGEQKFLNYLDTSTPDIDIENIELEDLNGNKTDLNNIKKPILLNCWATWCAPCIEEFIVFEKVKNEMGNKVEFIMISDESIEKTKSFLNKKSYTFNFFYTSSKFKDMGINSLPVTYFYNSKGQLVTKHVGGINEGELKELINKTL